MDTEVYYYIEFSFPDAKDWSRISSYTFNTIESARRTRGLYAMAPAAWVYRIVKATVTTEVVP